MLWLRGTGSFSAECSVRPATLKAAVPDYALFLHVPENRATAQGDGEKGCLSPHFRPAQTVELQKEGTKERRKAGTKNMRWQNECMNERKKEIKTEEMLKRG